MDSPATALHRVSKFRSAKWCAIVQFIKEYFSRLKELVDPFHLGILGEIAEAMPFIGNCVVVEECFQPYTFDIEDPAEKLEHIGHFPSQSQALADLSRKKSGLYGLFLLGNVP